MFRIKIEKQFNFANYNVFVELTFYFQLVYYFYFSRYILAPDMHLYYGVSCAKGRYFRFRYDFC